MPTPSVRSQLSAQQIAELVRQGELRAADVVAESYRRLDRAEPQIQAFLSLSKERAFAEAERIDQQVRAGNARGRLLGVPVAIKDNICSLGDPTTCASRILAGYRAVYDATVVARTKAEGAVVIGKT